MSTIYHYCPFPAFHSIIRNRNIRLTDLHQSNDRMEGGELIDILRRQMKKVYPNDKEIDQWLQTMEKSASYFQRFGFCLSRQPDLLSQWRGYANDGTGVMIGFNREVLEGLATSRKPVGPMIFQLADVQYGREAETKKIRQTAEKLTSEIFKGALKSKVKNTGGLLSGPVDDETLKSRREAGKILNEMEIMLNIVTRFSVKNEGFKEEMETRLFAACILPRHDSVDLNEDETRKLIEDIDFYEKDGKLIPFCELPINEPNLIDEIVLGPKCESPKHLVLKFLKKYGYGDVRVRNSKIPYA